MVKIFIAKNESVASAVRKIVGSEDSDITLVVPKHSVLKEPASNFEFLRREAGNAEKRVVIESVDDEVLALAAKYRLHAVHPLFQRDGEGRSLSDIVFTSASKGRRVVIKEMNDERKGTEGQKEKHSEKVQKGADMSHSAARDRGAWRKKYKTFLSLFAGFRFRFHKITAAAVGVIVLSVAAFIATTRVFGRADILVEFTTTPWEYQGAFLADKRFTSVNSEDNSLPAEVFTELKNVTQLFPASGRNSVSLKAAGKITIYNAYSSASQSLVASTRFVTPDGKVFRLDKGTVVPGAKVSEGKIIPSSIKAAVRADRPGPGYNLGPVEKLTIPGFQGSPKYEGFYGTITEPTSGGFVGEKAVPTDKDIANGREKVNQILNSALQVGILNRLPEEFRILDGASEIKITRLSVNKGTDDKGNFSVFGEAELRAIGFREADLRTILEALREKDRPRGAFRDLALTYNKVSADFGKGQLRFSLGATGTVAAAFDAEDFRNTVRGKKIKDIRAAISRLEGLTVAHVSVWPFWIRSAPKNPQNIGITVK